MAVRRVEIIVSVDDLDANKKLDALSLKLDRIKAKFDELSKKVISPKVGTDGITRANAELDKFKANLDAVGRKRVTANVNVDVNGNKFSSAAAIEGNKAIANMLDRKTGGKEGRFASLFGPMIPFFASLASKSGWTSLLGMGGGGGGAAGAPGAAGAAGGGGGFSWASLLGSPAGIGGILAALPSVAALADALIGQGLGSGVGAAAFLGAKHYDKLQTFTAPMRGVNSALSNVFKSVAPSIGMMVAQLGTFLKSPGMQTALAKLFSSALPFLQQLVPLAETFAKTVLPAITSTLRTFASSGALKAMTQGFVFIIQGIAGFIKAIGPGFKAGALVFRAVAMGIRGLLYGLGDAFGFLGKVAGIEYQKIHDWWDKLRHNTAVIFDGIRHEVAHVWDMVYQDTIGRVTRMVQSVINFNARLRQSIASTFDSIRHDIASAWDSIWHSTISAVSSGVGSVVRFFESLPGRIASALGSLGGLLYSIGRSAISSLISGLTSIGGKVGSFISSHLGFAAGGIVREPVFGFGLRSGNSYSFGERGPEMVTPLGGSAGSYGGGGGTTINITVQGDTNPDAAALRILQVLRKYKTRHGNLSLNLG